MWMWVLLYIASVGMNVMLLAVMPREFSLGPDGSGINIPGAFVVVIMSLPSVIITPFLIRANFNLRVRRQTHHPDT